MADEKPPASSGPERSSPVRDPWQAFSYLVSGVGFYGLVGFGLDRWLGTRFLVVVGILIGAVLGLYLTWKRLPAGSDQDPSA